MQNTIFVTGSSSGLGKAVTHYFANKGWNVIATMRNPGKGQMYEGTSNIKVIELDVTKPDTINQAVDESIQVFGRIDVLFNNVGYGGLTVFEETSDESFRNAFEANFFGHLNVVRAVLPIMRKQSSGFVINVTSLAGLFGLPMQTTYCSSKFAMTGFTEALKWELKGQGIDTTVFEVGGMKTAFANHMDNNRDHEISDYQPYLDKMIPTIEKATENFLKNAAEASEVAAQVYKLTQMRKKPFRFHPTKDGKIMGVFKRLLPDSLFRKLSTMGLDA